MIQVISDFVIYSSDWDKMIDLGYIVYANNEGLLKVINSYSFEVVCEQMYESPIEKRPYPFVVDDKIYLRYNGDIFLFDTEQLRFKQFMCFGKDIIPILLTETLVCLRGEGYTFNNLISSRYLVILEDVLGVRVLGQMLILEIRDQSFNTRIDFYCKNELTLIGSIDLGLIKPGPRGFHLYNQLLYISFKDMKSTSSSSQLMAIGMEDLTVCNIWEYMPNDYLRCNEKFLVFQDSSFAFINLPTFDEVNWTKYEVVGLDTLSIGKSTYIPSQQLIVSSSARNNIYLHDSHNFSLKKVIDFNKAVEPDFLHTPYLYNDFVYVPIGLSKLAITDINTSS